MATMNGTLKVSPEQLISAAENFNTEGNNIRSITDEMMNKVTSLTSVWEGEASQAYINKFKNLEDDIQRMLGMINEHVTDLNDMASEYSRAEQENADLASSLADDVIE